MARVRRLHRGANGAWLANLRSPRACARRRITRPGARSMPRHSTTRPSCAHPPIITTRLPAHCPQPTAQAPTRTSIHPSGHPKPNRPMPAHPETPPPSLPAGLLDPAAWHPPWGPLPWPAGEERPGEAIAQRGAQACPQHAHTGMHTMRRLPKRRKTRHPSPHQAGSLRAP